MRITPCLYRHLIIAVLSFLGALIVYLSVFEEVTGPLAEVISGLVWAGAYIFINLIFLLNHTVFDKIPADEFLDSLELVLFTAIPTLGIPAICLFLFGVQRYFDRDSEKSLKLSLVMYFFEDLSQLFISNNRFFNIVNRLVFTKLIYL